METTIIKCTMDDLLLLRDLAYKTYDETFRSQNSPATMDAYLEQSFALEKMRAELADRASGFYLLYAGKEPAGYLKLNEEGAQTDIHDPQSLEIERIYVGNEFQGLGLGRVLMDKALSMGYELGKSYLWLGVWEENRRAIGFYEKHGFYVSGRHPFYMGQEEQTDFIMRRDLG